MKRETLMGLTHLGDGPPRPIAGVLQWRVLVDPARSLGPQLPLRCDKCGNPHLTLTERELACRAPVGCGRTWFLVSGEPIESRGLSERTVARHHAAARVV